MAENQSSISLPSIQIEPKPQRKQRILALHLDSLAESTGGIEQFQDSILKAARDLYSAQCVEALTPLRQSAFTDWNAGYNINYVPFSTRAYIRKFQNRFSLNYLQFALHLAKTFQPTFVMATHVRGSPYAHLLHRFLGVPYFILAHGIEIWGKLSPVYEHTIAHANGIIANSRVTRDQLQRRGVPTVKLSILHPCVDDTFLGASLPASRPERPFTLLTVSRLNAEERYKGHDDVISALTQLRLRSPQLNWRYQILGEGSDRGRLEQTVKEKKLDPWITFHDFVPSRDALAKVFCEADAFIMPAHFGHVGRRWVGEGFGIVYAEAAAMGLPTVAYACGGVLDIVENGKSGLLVPMGDVNELSNAIERLASQPDLRRSLAAKARETATQHFTPMNLRRQLVQILDNF